MFSRVVTCVVLLIVACAVNAAEFEINNKVQCPPHQKFGPGPPADCKGPSDPLNKPPSKLEEWFTEEMFNDLFPKANLGWGPNRCSPYSYEAFIIAARYFPEFGSEYVTENPAGERLPTNFTPMDTFQRDVAAFFAHSIQETGENAGFYYQKFKDPADADECYYRGGFYNWFESSPACSFFPNDKCHEPEDGTVCTPAGRYVANDPNNDWFFPAGKDACYLGRGAIQISYNYNYGLFNNFLKEMGVMHEGKPIDLLENPNLVVTKQDPPLIIMASLWFYMTPQPPKPAMHDIIIGNWVAKPEDKAKGIAGAVLGPTSLVINNECGGEDTKVPGRGGENRRIKAFRFFGKYFGFDVGTDVSLSCKGFSGFYKKNVGLTYDQKWSTSWDTSTWCRCAPATYQGIIPYFQEGLYPKRWVAKNKDNEIKCEKALFNGWQKSCKNRPHFPYNNVTKLVERAKLVNRAVNAQAKQRKNAELKKKYKVVF